MTASTMPPWPHTAVVMIGGQSRRMGTAKHELTFEDGRTMLETTLDRLQCMSARQIISGPMDIRPEREHVTDLQPNRGPIGAIESVLKSNLDDRYLFVPCDMPRLTSELLKRLADALEHAEAVVFEQGTRPVRPVLPLGLRCSTAANLQELVEHETPSIHRFLETLHVAEVPLMDFEIDCLLNINTPEDWSTYLSTRESE